MTDKAYFQALNTSWVLDLVTAVNLRKHIHVILALGMLVFLTASIGEASGIMGSLNVTVEGSGKGYVTADLNASIKSELGSNTSCYASVKSVNNVHLSSNEDLWNLNYVINLTSPAPKLPQNQGETLGSPSPKLNELNLTLKANQSAMNGEISGSTRIWGWVLLSNNGTVNYDVILMVNGTYNRTDVKFNATVDVGPGALTVEDMGRLKLVLAILSPEMLNSQLRKSNVTWIKVKNLHFTFTDEGNHTIIKGTGDVLLTAPPKNVTIKALKTPLMEDLMNISKALRQLNVKSYAEVRLNLRNEEDRLEVFSTGFMRGALNGNASLLYDSINQALLDVGKETNASWLGELRILPSNTTFSAEVKCGGGLLTVNLRLGDLRLAHSQLRGMEGESRVASIIKSVTEVAAGVLEPNVTVNFRALNIPNVSADSNIMRSVVEMFIKARNSSEIPPQLKQLMGDLGIKQKTNSTHTTEETATVTATYITTTSTTTQNSPNPTTQQEVKSTTSTTQTSSTTQPQSQQPSGTINKVGGVPSYGLVAAAAVGAALVAVLAYSLLRRK